MSRLIDADHFLKTLQMVVDVKGDDVWGRIAETMGFMVECEATFHLVGELKTGKWVDTDPNTPDASYRKEGMAYFCSNCGHRAGKYKHKTYRFCPWCGADMRGETDE